MAAACGFTLAQGSALPATCAVTADRLGHGSALAGILVSLCPQVILFNAQVFSQRLSCSARQVAAAIDWLVAQDVAVINMSFGMRSEQESLRQACARALAAGVVLVASAPARGAPVLPASIPGVLRATGDARCAPDELSWLGSDQADFGACVRSADAGVAGASVGCAHLSAHVAAYLATTPGAGSAEVVAWLKQRALYHGPEHRQA